MDIGVRSEAEKALVNFSDSPESLPQCQIILERSQVRYMCKPPAVHSLIWLLCEVVLSL